MGKERGRVEEGGNRDRWEREERGWKKEVIEIDEKGKREGGRRR